MKSKIVVCPKCKSSLDFSTNNIFCENCNANFKYDDGLPLLFWKNEWENEKYDVTEEIQSFYMDTPFPNYDDIENAATLREKSRKQIYAQLLDDQIPYTGKVLEVGCGTGQTCNLLAMTKTRIVFGADMTLNSLKLGDKFRQENKIKNLKFVQMNLFKPVFKEETFDVVICNGVLHHTSDPLLGFESISKLVKKGGYIIIGLYNKYGRIFTDIRRSVFTISNENFKSLDSRVRDDISDKKKHTWYMDQYKNPHESKHTVDEVLSWFENNGFEFLNCIPDISGKPLTPDTKIFEAQDKGSKTKRFATQFKMIFEDKEGGFYTMIARKL